MIEPIRRTLLFVAYQLTLLAGILAMPIALVLRQAGVTLPVHRLVQSLGRAYETC